MTIAELGSLGELVAAIATVLTLAYLALQIRQNTKATHAQATASVASEMEQALLAIAQNDVLSEAYVKATQRKELSGVETARLGFWWSAFLRSAHSHIVQDGLGNLSEDNRVAIATILRQFSQVPMLRDQLRALIDQGMYPRDFCEWVCEHVLSEKL
jgi:hypothetical protein